jgi:hypothetical protein
MEGKAQLLGQHIHCHVWYCCAAYANVAQQEAPRRLGLCMDGERQQLIAKWCADFLCL